MIHDDHSALQSRDQRERFSRRRLLAGAALLTGCAPAPRLAGPKGRAAVTIVRAASYTADLADILLRGVTACGLVVRGRRILLKPNLVEFDSSTAVNTHAAIVAAAVEVFTKLGASEVRIGEGPGHRRDTIFLAEEAGYRRGVADFDRRFIDLNRDDVAAVDGFADEARFYLPRAALGADVIVSLAKMKTHHWAGATLAMKNFFGLVPGAIYGWPKNRLHYIGIDRAVRELYRLFPRSFAIVDGITGMEGNGPIQGSPRSAGVVVMGGDLVAVDATCCRIMGIDPNRIEYLRLAGMLGHSAAGEIDQRGETLASVQTRFELPAEFRHARLA
ncbi:MAG: DUF362 domain-containing protein [Acidobacteriales bacterium]|nr:DUF362 domain-containing protein [Terriglobales bacterium]